MSRTNFTSLSDTLSDKNADHLKGSYTMYAGSFVVHNRQSLPRDHVLMSDPVYTICTIPRAGAQIVTPLLHAVVNHVMSHRSYVP